MNLDKEILGKKIRQLSIQRGFSQEALSERIDISPRHMCTIENGNSFPSIETFVKIAEILDMDINQFFNLSSAKNDKLKSEIYDLVQVSNVKQLNLIRDIIKVIHLNSR